MQVMSQHMPARRPCRRFYQHPLTGGESRSVIWEWGYHMLAFATARKKAKMDSTARRPAPPCSTPSLFVGRPWPEGGRGRGSAWAPRHHLPPQPPQPCGSVHHCPCAAVASPAAPWPRPQPAPTVAHQQRMCAHGSGNPHTAPPAALEMLASSETMPRSEQSMRACSQHQRPRDVRVSA